MRPDRVATLGGMARPPLVVVGAACLLLLVQPELGTALIIAFLPALAVAATLRDRGAEVESGAPAKASRRGAVTHALEAATGEVRAPATPRKRPGALAK